MKTALRSRRWRTGLGGLLLLAALHADAAPAPCDDTAQAARCEQARLRVDVAEQAWRQQQAQLRQVQLQQSALKQLDAWPSQRDERAVALLTRADAWDSARLAFLGHWRLLQTSCAQALAALDPQQSAAQRYRRAAQTFARAAQQQAAAAAIASERGLDTLRMAETQLDAGSRDCSAAAQQAESASRQLESAAGSLRESADWAAHWGRDLEATALRATKPAWPRTAALQAAVQQQAAAQSQAIQRWAESLAPAPQLPATAGQLMAAVSPRQTALLRQARWWTAVQDADSLDQLLAGSPCKSSCAETTTARQARLALERTLAAERNDRERRAQLDLGLAAQTPQMEAAVQRMPVPKLETVALAAALRNQEALELQLLQARRDELEQAHLAAFGQPWSEPIAVGQSHATSGSGGGAAASMAIARQHAYHFWNAQTPEPDGFAAYTDVILTRRLLATPTLRQLYRSTLAEIVGGSSAVRDVSRQERGDFNLFCIPSTRAAELNRHPPDDPDQLLQAYDMVLAKQRITHLSAGAALRLYVNAPERGFGPLLITRFKPLAATRAGDRFLIFDLSGVDPSFVADLLAGYKQRFEEAPPQEALEIWRPTLARRVVMNVAQLGQLIARLQKSQDSWKALQDLGGTSKQTLVRVQ